MTIAALPSLPVDLAVPGATGTTAVAAAATVDSFAALVLAVLDAGAPAVEQPAVLTPQEVPVALDEVTPAPRVTTDPTTAADATRQDATSEATADLLPDAPEADAQVAVLPMPVTLPAPLAAALGLGSVVPASPAAGLSDVPASPSTTSPDPVVGPTGGPALNQLQSTSSSPLLPRQLPAATGDAPAAPGAPGAPATPTAPTPDATGGPALNQVQSASSSPAVQPTETPAAVPTGHTAQPTETPVTEHVAPAAQPTETPPAAPTDHTAHTAPPSTPSAQAAQVHEATRTTAPGRTDEQAGAQRAERAEGTQRTEPGAQADAPAPTLVQGTTAPTRVADQPTTGVTRAAAAQVVPELTRLVQAGPGTHRMVLRLDPEHLGEVRITLTVHPGGVRVRMATGTEDARAALTDGIQVLQRALETASGRPAGETQLAVLHQARPQDATTTTYGGESPSAQGDAQASPHQTPGDRHQADDRAAGRPAGTQVDITARDGSQDGGASGTPRPADPLPSFRSTRLDVSM